MGVSATHRSDGLRGDDESRLVTSEASFVQAHGVRAVCIESLIDLQLKHFQIASGRLPSAPEKLCRRMRVRVRLRMQTWTRHVVWVAGHCPFRVHSLFARNTAYVPLDCVFVCYVPFNCICAFAHGAMFHWTLLFNFLMKINTPESNLRPI